MDGPHTAILIKLIGRAALEALEAWEAAHAATALNEGWAFTVDYDDGVPGVYFICVRAPDPGEADCTTKHIELPTDEAAEAIVMAGTLPYHAAARALLAEHSPQEWARIVRQDYTSEPAAILASLAKR